MIRKFKNFYHLGIAIVSNIIFGFPGRKIVVIGVTGTDGKTTTVNLIYHILKENGKRVSMLTSIGANVEGKKYDTGFHVTTPSSFTLQKLLRKAVNKKSEYFVLEVTSHAIDQYRTWGIPFRVGVLTNITREHLDYHKTYDKYLKTKEKLLIDAKVAVVNRDDASYALLSQAKTKKDNKNWVTYGLSDGDINLSNSQFESRVLIGEFNKLNALAAIGACVSAGIPTENASDAIKSFKMPLGRLDFVYNEKFFVVIDFAHTPNAFEQLLCSLRKECKGKIIHVFGSAGERDKEKRPFMGEISSKYADIIILTAEDPRSEDVNDIIEEIASGIKRKDAKVIRTPDRKDAINAAIEMADANDLVIITGKAHEKSMTYGKDEKPWDEYQIVEKAIESRTKL